MNAMEVWVKGVKCSLACRYGMGEKEVKGRKRSSEWLDGAGGEGIRGREGAKSSRGGCQCEGEKEGGEEEEEEEK